VRDSIDTVDNNLKRGDSPPNVAHEPDGESDDEMMHQTLEKTSAMMYNTGATGSYSSDQVGNSVRFQDDHDGDEDDESSSDDDGDTSMDPSKRPGQVYGKIDVASLNVSGELRELFEYITRFTPAEIELDTKLKPFIPEYIPSVGDIDAFIKVPRPDEKPDLLGLSVLDEPSAKQSDPSVLELKLRTFARGPIRTVVVHGIENAEKNKKAVATWIEKISELHQGKPPPNVQYSKVMPDIDTLMQEWPSEIEELLNQVLLPTAELDVSLQDYIRIICGILDIPVYNNYIEPLHVLFTLYASFKENQHFNFQDT